MSLISYCPGCASVLDWRIKDTRYYCAYCDKSWEIQLSEIKEKEEES